MNPTDQQQGSSLHLGSAEPCMGLMQSIGLSSWVRLPTGIERMSSAVFPDITTAGAQCRPLPSGVCHCACASIPMDLQPNMEDSSYEFHCELHNVKAGGLDLFAISPIALCQDCQHHLLLQKEVGTPE